MEFKIICIINKTEFKYYRSREQFITLQKPTKSINIKDIIEVNFIDKYSIIYNYQKFKKLNNFYFGINYKINDNIDIENDIYDKKFLVKENENKKNNINNTNIKTDLLILSSNDKELINKWILILNYLINKSKKDNKNTVNI